MRTMLNGLIRAGGTAYTHISLVMPDGVSTRYYRNMYYDVHKMSGLIKANLGGTAEAIDFCPSINTRQKSFFIIYAT